MIPQETIRKITDAAQVDEVISDFVTLKKRGVNYIGLCPFHDEKTPSFTVSPAKGIYKCFGCGKAGDSVRFLMEHDQLPYPDALRFLASKYNIEIEEKELTQADRDSKDLRESLFLVNNFALEFFANTLFNNEKGKAIAHSYLIERGFDDKTIERFKIGYCLDEWGHFSQGALDKGYKKEFLEKTGLSILRNDKLIDRFKGRVIFPIHNLSGMVIGFGGRTLRSDKKIAKYINSPESDIYSKSHQLYGLFFAKKSIVQQDKCYLVEGYTDVISMYQSGVENAAAPLGTSLTADQIKLIHRYTKNVVLLFDGDEAGTKASIRGIDMLLEGGMNVKLVKFPEGEDPDSYSKAHSDEAFKGYLHDNEIDFITYQLQAQKDDWKNDPIKKAAVMKSILGSISKIQDHLLRSLFLKDFSQKLEIEEKSALFELNRIRRNTLKTNYNSPETVVEEKPKFTEQKPVDKLETKESRFKKEEKIIELLFKFGVESLTFQSEDENAGEIQILVSEYIIGEIEKDHIEFENNHFNKIYQAYAGMVEDSTDPEHRHFLEHQDDDIRKLSYELLSTQYTLSSNWKDKYHILTNLEEEDLKRSVNRALYSLKLSEVIKRLTEFEEKMKDAEDDELMDLIKYSRSLSEAKKALAEKLGMTLT